VTNLAAHFDAIVVACVPAQRAVAHALDGAGLGGSGGDAVSGGGGVVAEGAGAEFGDRLGGK
jgi:hypothetical protein